jgi:hypothetical protein
MAFHIPYGEDRQNMFDKKTLPPEVSPANRLYFRRRQYCALKTLYLHFPAKITCLMILQLRRYLEPLIWTAALVVLFCMNVSDTHSLCLFRMAGISHCPGCGIGHAIHDALHLRFVLSFNEHLLGIPATLLIIYSIIKSLLTLQKQKHHGSKPTVHDATRHTAG